MALVDENGQIVYHQEQILTEADGDTIIRQVEKTVDPVTGQETQTVQQTHIDAHSGQIQTQKISASLDPFTGS